MSNVLLEQKENVAVITINRPDKLNALNHDTLNELKTIFEQIKDSSNIRCSIITGSGPKAFVAGADIKELSMLNEQTGKEFAAFGQSIFNLIEQHGKPVIAAVNGFALGGGCELAMACHIRLASVNARFGQPEINLGIIPGYGGTQRLTKLIGAGRATELLLTGNMISAEEALSFGLVNRVVPLENLMNEAHELAKTISEKSGSVSSKILDTVYTAVNSTLEEGLAKESSLFGQCCASTDFKEGTSAFLEKRKPIFNQ